MRGAGSCLVSCFLLMSQNTHYGTPPSPPPPPPQLCTFCTTTARATAPGVFIVAQLSCACPAPTTHVGPCIGRLI